MSIYAGREMSLAGIDVSGLSYEELAKLFQQTLQAGIHGLSFSPYLDGQSPEEHIQISEQQIRQRLSIIKPYVKWIRSFSCVEGNQATPRIAREYGLNTMVGVSLGDDLEKNEIEMANGIELAKAGDVDILAIGNEVLLRGDLSETQLLAYIERAKAAVPNVDVSYVDAYFKFHDYPAITDACDVILANCYPFWESCPADYALLYMKDMYRRTVDVAGGKKVIISETGWPNRGSNVGACVPSDINAMRYFINTCRWASEENIEIFYFSSFDESWKVGDEGDVGAYWGLWDTKGNLKYV